MIEISHTPAEGTVVFGTSRGDGAAEVLKQLGWRWGRTIQAWYVPRSRDSFANRDVIEKARVALADVGHEVVVKVEDGYRTAAEVERDRAERAEARAAALEARAERNLARAAAHDGQARELADAIPFGQPVLVGHHSEARDRRYRSRIASAMDRSVEAWQKADSDIERARAARVHAARREAPATVANRLRKLEAERKQWAAASASAVSGTSYAARAAAEVERLTGELDYWAGVRAHQVESGQAVIITREQVKPGDLVKVARSGWWLVERVNPTTVTVTSRGARIRERYDQLEGHRASPEQAS